MKLEDQVTSLELSKFYAAKISQLLASVVPQNKEVFHIGKCINNQDGCEDCFKSAEIEGYNVAITAMRENISKLGF